MLKKLKIKNFQKHKSLELEFGPGLNIIAGKSASGKSSIIRALKFAARNRPSKGFSFKTWNTKGTERTSVELEFDNGSIKRDKTKTLNQYIINGDSKSPLEAFGSEVPAQVQEVCNMDDFNIQSQFDSYFMLQDTPGDVAKKFNEVVGLEIIDETQKNINSIVDKARKERDDLSIELGQLQQKLDRLKIVDRIESVITDFDSNLKEVEVLTLDIDNLKENLTRLNRAIDEKKDIDKWLEVELSFIYIQEEIDNSISLSNQIDKCNSIIDEISVCSNECNEIYDLIVIENDILSLDNIYNECSMIANKERSTRTVISIIEEKSKLLQQKDNFISKKESEFNNLLKQTNNCPTCGSKLDSNTIMRLI